VVYSEASELGRGRRENGEIALMRINASHIASYAFTDDGANDGSRKNKLRFPLSTRF